MNKERALIEETLRQTDLAVRMRLSARALSDRRIGPRIDALIASLIEFKCALREGDTHE
jgi:hypothetical protein